MSGATTELALSTAVDSDDQADYLTLSLANSLRTVDALFNSITGHNHGGAHQGGAIAPAAIPGGSITNAMLGADVARANLLTNGGMELWQRGTGAFTANGAYTADRWKTFIQGTSTMSVNRVPAANAGTYACGVVYTHNTVSQLIQLVQGADCVTQARTLTLSMLVNVGTANAVSIQISSNGTGGAAASSANHPGDSTWRMLSVSYTVPGDATNLQVAVTFQASCTAYLDNAMLVVGSQAANYVPMHPADDLARCLRYYEKIGGVVNQQFGQSVAFAGKKALTPTMTKAGTWSVLNFGQPTVFGQGIDGFNLNALSIAAGIGTVAETDATCFVTAESNP
jgi:hypothetical protein